MTARIFITAVLATTIGATCIRDAVGRQSTGSETQREVRGIMIARMTANRIKDWRSHYCRGTRQKLLSRSFVTLYG
jgi:hypothetical protein